MKIRFGILIIMLILSSTAITLAESQGEEIELKNGENIVNMSFEFSPLYVQDLIKYYPEISAVTINESGELKGYVNVFGGIGNNFLIEPNKNYEIITKQDLTIILK
jgi:hypothetical protein